MNSPAFLRRFDYAMELNTPPRSTRLNIVHSRLADTPVSETFMQRLSEHDELPPAQVTQAAKALQRSGRGNICFYGAPGTGKTALAGLTSRAYRMIS